MVESKERQESDLKRLEKNLDKAKTEATKQLLYLSRQSFACVADALTAASKLSKKLKYHQLVALNTQEIQPKSLPKNSSSSYKVTAGLEVKSDVVEAERRQAGRFILATNVLDVNQLSPDDMIAKYKNQQSAERGFSFLKDPFSGSSWKVVSPYCQLIMINDNYNPLSSNSRFDLSIIA